MYPCPVFKFSSCLLLLSFKSYLYNFRQKFFIRNVYCTYFLPVLSLSFIFLNCVLISFSCSRISSVIPHHIQWSCLLRLLLVFTVSQTLVFNDLDSFADYWSDILQNVPQLGFVIHLNSFLSFCIPFWDSPKLLNDFLKFVYIKIYSLCYKSLWILTDAEHLVFTTAVSYKISFTALKIPMFCLFNQLSSAAHRTPGNILICFTSLQFCIFQMSYSYGSIQYEALSHWLLSLSNRHLSFLHVFSWLISSFLFIAG